MEGPASTHGGNRGAADEADAFETVNPVVAGVDPLDQAIRQSSDLAGVHLTVAADPPRKSTRLVRLTAFEFGR